MRTSIRSKLYAAILALGLATPLSMAHSVMTATPAEAGALGSLKSAAKSVGSAVKSGAKAVGGGAATAAKAVGGGTATAAKAVGGGTVVAAKAVGGGAVTVGKAVGVGAVRIGRGFERTGKDIYHSGPGQSVVKFVKSYSDRWKSPR